MKIKLSQLKRIIKEEIEKSIEPLDEEASDCRRDYEAGGLTQKEYEACLARYGKSLDNMDGDSYGGYGGRPRRYKGGVGGHRRMKRSKKIW